MSELEKKIYKPIYLLQGEEAYYIDKITNYIVENILTESEKSFNQTITYGKDSDVYNLITLARRFPMMANHQVVVLKEAQDLQKIEELYLYANKPLDSTIFVINYKYKSLPKNRKLYKSINKIGAVFDSKKLYDNQIPAWIDDYLKEQSVSISQPASILLSEFLGNNLSKISNELEKLILTLPSGERKITPKHIEDNIGISKDYNTFELTKSLGQKNALKTNRIINYFASNPKVHNITAVISGLYYYFSKILAYFFIKDKSNKFNVASELKINPYFVDEYRITAKNYGAKKVVEIISILREYDLKAKGVGNVSATHGQLLKEMIYKILH